MRSRSTPREILLVRHGESVANVASMEAERSGSQRLDVTSREADVPLSEQGEQQADAVGRWLRDLDPDDTPQAVWSSPYLRAHDTARRALRAAGLDLQVRLDERLRDRDLGVFDRLSTAGIKALEPDEAERRAWHGKFYHRPGGGESWTDLAARVRAFLADLESLADPPERVLITCHDAVIMTFRYVCEGLTEEEVLALARDRPVGNASLTLLRRDDSDPLALAGSWHAVLTQADDHLTGDAAEHTDEPGSSDV